MISRYLFAPIALTWASFLVVSTITVFSAQDKKSIAVEYANLLDVHKASPADFLRDPPRAMRAGRAFLEFAHTYPNEAVAFDAIKWVVTHILFRGEAEEALNVLSQNYAERADLAAIVRELDMLYGEPFDPVDTLFRQLSKSSPDRVVRGEACLALSRKIRQKREKADRDELLHVLRMRGERVPYAVGQNITEGEWQRLAEERTSLLQLVMRDYADITWGKKNLSELAFSELHSVVTHSQAPEIDSDDVHGNRLRLSNTRGKIVVLSFSANWCAPCVAGYPQHRQLAKSLNDRPFVLLSVNADPEKGTLEKAIASGDITWRCWWDGPDGPIRNRWNVNSFPTTFVIDHQGVVRFKNPSGRALELAVDMLLDEIDEI